MGWQEAWVDRYYRSRPGWTDGTTDFHALCASFLPRGGRILEVGAGPTNPTSAFLATLGEVHGVDVDEEVLSNRHLTSSKVLVNDKVPFPDEHFDLAVSNYVVEHVRSPSAHLSEIHRVLKPGGRYIFRTPNLTHYVSLVSLLTPYVTHRVMANRLRNLRDHHDPWPTVYAMNTPGLVRRFAGRAGFEVERLDLVEKEPCYGMAARPLFLVFMAYERVVNSSPLLSRLRSNMFVVLRRS